MKDYHYSYSVWCYICDSSVAESDSFCHKHNIKEQQHLSFRKMIIRCFKDGDQWCALQGSNLQEGHGEFADSLTEAAAKMQHYLQKEGLL